MVSDSNLLLGVLALQMDLINRDDLIRALHTWVLEKAKPLAQILEESGKLGHSDRLILESLVARRQEVTYALSLPGRCLGHRVANQLSIVTTGLPRPANGP